MGDDTPARARLVELLWQLKQNYDRAGDTGLGFIHFNTLLNDARYRAEIIERACHSPHSHIRHLGEELARLDHADAVNNARPQATSTGSSRFTYRRLAWPLVIGTLSLFLLLFWWLALSYLQGDQVITGVIDQDQTWTADRDWVLGDVVYVMPGVRLTIEPGTRILGRADSALVVTRGARLHAAGREDAPIVFTSIQPEGKRTAGDWGGLVLLGDAPVNQPDAQIEGIDAGDPLGAYGGQNPQGSCGVLEYARIEFAGFEVYANNELNGLTLGGCGSGTIVRHVQVHRPLDDGVEVFGGNVDLRHIVITGAGDDGLDWDLGWRGRVQFLVVQPHQDTGDNAFEADNNGAHHQARPRSEPVMYNVTLVSPRSSTRHHRAMTLREGTGGHFRNLLISGFSGEAIDLRDTATVGNLDTGALEFQGMLMHGIGPRGLSYFETEQGEADDDGGFDEDAFFRGLGGIRFGEDPHFNQDVINPYHPTVTPALRSPATRGAVPVPQGEFWDEAAVYLGAVRPGASATWLDRWTAFPAR
ncbi:hypothetical protein [Alcanivorax sp. 24]|uniref:hypothetical protein n=1 Tax=Alcanivorax sp. 24 TaxID=2545266 RepID=UPI00105EB738|nr:hypothetical protein [Alcanivorax sp. 24]